MLRPLLSFALLGTLLLAPAHAQCNASLAIGGSGQAGATLTFDVTGAAPAATVFLLVGQSSATVPLNLGALGSITLLAPPFVPLPLGMADLFGHASLALGPIPSGVPCTTLYAQGLTLGLNFLIVPPSLSACTTNVAAFSVGC
jgi:hypothetical protein